MGAVALKRIRIGDGFKEPGDSISDNELKGRNVRSMERLGQVNVEVPKAKTRRPVEPGPDPRPVPDPPADTPLAERSRKELNQLAADLGLDPRAFPNKAAIVAAIEERSDSQGE